jgi:predicted TPR repeat methyltransferase
MKTVQTLQSARQHHQACRLPEAQALYDQILGQEPNHPEALQLRGILAAQLGHHDEAADLIGRAIALKPNYPEAHFNLGNVLKTMGQLDAAIAAYRQAIALKPSYAESYNNLGTCLREKGKLDEAVAAYRKAIAFKPNYPKACSNLGLALKEQGQLDAAVAACRQAITLQPNFAEAHYNLGTALDDQQQPDAAITAYRQAIALQPKFPEAYGNLGKALKAKGQLDEAIAAYREAILLKPNLPEAHGNLGNALKDAGRLDEAAAAYREAIRLNENAPEFQFSLAALTGDPAARTAPAQYVQSLFDQYASRFDQHLMGKLEYHTPELLLETVLAAAPGRKFDILDLGCGTGLCGVQFHPHAQRMVGVDLSPNMLQIASDRRIYDQLVAGDVTAALLDRQDHFDLVLAGDVFVYVGDLGELFPAAARVLGPWGLFAFSIERYDGAGFALHRHLRFAHSLAYIRELARKHRFAEIQAREVMLRKQAIEQVPGWIVVLAKTGIAPELA